MSEIDSQESQSRAKALDTIIISEGIAKNRKEDE